jgi:hypothetical protein
VKMTIEVPDVLPVSFENPSLELLRFLKEFQDLCIRLTRDFKRADGWDLFNAFVRNGAESVFCTRVQATMPIAWESGPTQKENDANDDDPIPEDYEYQSVPVQHVAMASDKPGDWIVARLCLSLPGRPPYINFFSSDFCREGKKKSKVEQLMPGIVKSLKKRAHVVPEPNA